MPRPVPVGLANQRSGLDLPFFFGSLVPRRGEVWRLWPDCLWSASVDVRVPIGDERSKGERTIWNEPKKQQGRLAPGCLMSSFT